MGANSLLNNKRGFSLFELTVVIAIMSIVLGAVYSVFASVNRSTTSNEVRAEVMQNLRISIDIMEQDIRMAGLDRFRSANASIEFVDDDNFTLRFTADRNMDGVINVADLSGESIQEEDLEDITYRYDQGNNRLEQCLSESTINFCQTVAENVTDFQFTYLDAGDTPIFPPYTADKIGEIRTVLVSMTIEQPAGRAGLINRTLTKRILCRNLFFQ
jgi:type II secretion system protein J